MVRQNSNLVGRLKKLLDNEVAHVGRAKVTLPESENPREEAEPAGDVKKKKSGGE